MKFELLFSCLAGLIIIVQSTSLIAEKKDFVSKYSLKLLEGEKNFDEKIEIDIEKETETFHVPKTSPDEEAGDIIYDFKRNVTMIRLPAAQACYIAHSIDDAIKPADLREALELPTTRGTAAPTEKGMTVVGNLEDRSELSDEMEDLCAKLPIYIVIKGDVDPNDIPQITDFDDIPNTRVKRFLGFRRRKFKRWVCRMVCRWETRRICEQVPNGSGLQQRCHNVRRRVCKRVCSWIFG